MENIGHSKDGLVPLERGKINFEAKLFIQRAIEQKK